MTCGAKAVEMQQDRGMKSAGNSQCARPAMPCTRSAPSVLLLIKLLPGSVPGRGSLLGVSVAMGVPVSLGHWLEKVLACECLMASEDQPGSSLASLGLLDLL